MVQEWGGKSIDEELLNIRCNFGGVIADKQNDGHVSHRGMCHNTEICNSVNLQLTTDQTVASFSEDYYQQMQFSAAGLGSETELKVRLLALVFVWYSMLVCVQFCNLLPSSKCCYMLTV